MAKQKSNLRVEHRWFPASQTTGLLGGTCADTEAKARAFLAPEDVEVPLVRVRLEYELPSGKRS